MLLRRAIMGADNPRPPACGVDLVEIATMARSIELGGEAFLQRIYTERELDLCRGRLPHLAEWFAAKEAIAKALGTGMRGVTWREMEVLAEQEGRPYVRLHGRAAARATQLGLDYWTVSLTHCGAFAIAYVVSIGCGEATPAADGDEGQKGQDTLTQGGCHE